MKPFIDIKYEDEIAADSFSIAQPIIPALVLLN